MFVFPEHFCFTHLFRVNKLQSSRWTVVYFHIMFVHNNILCLFWNSQLWFSFSLTDRRFWGQGNIKLQTCEMLKLFTVCCICALDTPVSPVRLWVKASFQVFRLLLVIQFLFNEWSIRWKVQNQKLHFQTLKENSRNHFDDLFQVLSVQQQTHESFMSPVRLTEKPACSPVQCWNEEAEPELTDQLWQSWATMHAGKHRGDLKLSENESAGVQTLSRYRKCFSWQEVMPHIWVTGCRSDPTGPAAAECKEANMTVCSCCCEQSWSVVRVSLPHRKHSLLTETECMMGLKTLLLLVSLLGGLGKKLQHFPFPSSCLTCFHVVNVSKFEEFWKWSYFTPAGVQFRFLQLVFQNISSVLRLTSFFPSHSIKTVSELWTQRRLRSSHGSQKDKSLSESNTDVQD